MARHCGSSARACATVGRCGRVGATNRRVRIFDVAVGAVGCALVVLVVERENARRVAVDASTRAVVSVGHWLWSYSAEITPSRTAPSPAARLSLALPLGIGFDAAFAIRFCTNLRGSLPSLQLRANLRAALREVAERQLESARLRLVLIDRVDRRVDCAVEHDRAHLVGICRGVLGTDQRAVRVTEVGQLRIAQRRRAALPCRAPFRRSSSRSDPTRRRGSTRLRPSSLRRCFAAQAASVVGSAGSVSSASFCLFGMQLSGWLRPMPRGSKPTMSNRSRIASGNSSTARPIAASTPEPPGPPGLMTNEPNRLCCVAARTRSTVMLIVLPVGVGPVQWHLHHRAGEQKLALGGADFAVELLGEVGPGERSRPPATLRPSSRDLPSWLAADARRRCWFGRRC